MFWQIFVFELKYRIKRPATYIYFIIFLLIAFLSVATGSTPATEKVFHNSTFVIAEGNVLFSMIMMLVCSAIMGVPLYRDIEHHTKNYYLTYPITKSGYFWGRYFGSFIFVAIIGLSVSLGLYLGSVVGPLFGWVPAERMGPNHFVNYIYPYFTLALPNLFLASSIFFGLVAFFKNVKVIYTGSILLFIAYLLSNFLTRDIDNKDLVKILDAFAVNTFNLETRFFTPVEKNTLLVPIKGLFLLNRLLWAGLGLIILLITYFTFSFERFFSSNSSKKLAVNDEEKDKFFGAKFPEINISFETGYYRKIMFNLSKIEFLNIVRDNYFKAILLGAIIFLGVDFWIGVTTYGVSALPLTVNLMQYKNFDYVLFIFIIIIFYTGEAIHREKASGFGLINDALPTPDWVLYGSKLLGLTGLAFLLATFPMIMGVIVQVLKGYFDFNFPVYLKELYLISFPQYMQIVFLSFAVHIFVNNKFAGHAVGLLIWIVMFLLRSFGEMNYNLFFYSYYPTYQWSDMDGINSAIKGIFWFNLYWMMFGAFIMTIAALFFNRGALSGRKERWKMAKQRFTGFVPYAMTIFFIGFVVSGIYTYYNVSVVNNYLTVDEGRYRQAEYEKKLKKYENIIQPKITAIKVSIDVYPNTRTTHTNAALNIINKSNQPISDIHLNGSSLDSFTVKYNNQSLADIKYPLVYKRGKFNFFRPSTDTANYRIYHLSQPLMPQDSAILEIHSVNTNKGFTNEQSGTDILQNGTFFSGGLPSFGYDSQGELASDEKRKKFGLPKKDDELPPYNDKKGLSTLLFNKDADLVSMDITVSTIKGQTAIAPGKKVKTWETDGRVYTQFVQNSPKVDLFFDVVSAEYLEKMDNQKLPNGQNVALELYYQKGHDKNLNRFMDAFKDGLDYYSKSYSNYQFEQLRLLEFPKYRSFAQSFPNTISYSESFGYTADFKPSDFDYGYFVTAHELAHQWWGHQVVPSRTKGANLISEALAEYTALILCERKYGRDNMKRFLKQELDGYLSGRANEAKKENLFIDCNRPYQWYQKGSLILYGLRDLIGEDELNTALKEFAQEWAFKENPPFASSHDLYNAIDKHVPDSLKYYLVDTWKKITLYENKVLDVKVEPTKIKGQSKITLKVFTRKMYADSKGNEKPASIMDDYIDIGIFAADSKDKEGRTITNPIYLKKHKLAAGEHTFTLTVKGDPSKVGIDPYVKLIDRIPDDNVKDI
jgi:ABC-2 type transport system permease protein